MEPVSGAIAQKSLTASEENYLKCLYVLEQSQNGPVHTNDVAAYMHTKASSATDMVQRLSKKGYVHYRAYHGTTLSEKGTEAAVQVVRRHRLWETFLHLKLRFRWDQVHALADQLEHIASPELTDRLDALLDYPKYDPHGEPIPSASGAVNDPRKPVPLSTLQAGNIGRIVAVSDHSQDFLKYLETTNLILGSRIEVNRLQAFDGSMHVQLAVREVVLSEKVTQRLLIEVHQ